MASRPIPRGRKRMSLKTAYETIKEAAIELEVNFRLTEKKCHGCQWNIELRWEVLDLLEDYFGADEAELFKALFLYCRFPLRRADIGQAITLVLKDKMGLLETEDSTED